jgi:spore coat protein U-like protein
LKGLILLGILLSVLVAVSPAFALTATANIAVSATVTTNCTIAANPLAFGTYDPAIANSGTALVQTTTLSVTCTQGATGVTIGLDAGQNATHATGTTRAMTTGGGTPSYLSYEIYQDSARTTVWGNTGAAQVTLPTPSSNAAQTLTAYGRIPANESVPAGSYGDTVIATVNF